MVEIENVSSLESHVGIYNVVISQLLKKILRNLKTLFSINTFILISMQNLVLNQSEKYLEKSRTREHMKE